MPIKCVLKWQPPFLTPVKKCMNWHICKLISVFLQWPRLPYVLGCCILCLRKAKNISYSQNLCAAGESSFLKQVLRQEGGVVFSFSVAWRKKKRQYLCLLIFQGPYLLFICIDLPQAETPWELQLPSAKPLTVLTIRLKEALFSLHPPHVASLLPRAISWERKSFKLHGSGKDWV